MRTIVNTIVSGRLARNAEIKFTNKGVAVVSLAIPTEIGWYDNKKTIWLNISWYGKTAEEKAPKLVKGSEIVAVCGEADIPSNSKGNALYYTAKTVEVRKYGDGAETFQDSFDSGYVSEFAEEDEFPF